MTWPVNREWANVDLLCELIDAGIPWRNDGFPPNSRFGSVIYGRLRDFVLTRRDFGWLASGKVPIPIVQELVKLAPDGTVLVDGNERKWSPRKWGEVDDEGNRFVYRLDLTNPEGLLLFRQVMQKHGLHRDVEV